jgi:RNA polymerase sigma-70 factor (ECF subfamily)
MAWFARRRTEGIEAEALQHLDALYNLAVHLTRDESAAGDLVQETYVKVLRFGERFKPGTDLKAWLFTILRNTWIDLYWKRSREILLAAPADLDGAAADIEGPAGGLDAGTPDTRLPDRIYRADLEAALEKLPEGFRTAILLADVEGFTYEEIAQVMGCPPGTVKSRLFRGRKLLREMLRDYGR